MAVPVRNHRLYHWDPLHVASHSALLLFIAVFKCRLLNKNNKNWGIISSYFRKFKRVGCKEIQVSKFVINEKAILRQRTIFSHPFNFLVYLTVLCIPQAIDIILYNSHMIICIEHGCQSLILSEVKYIERNGIPHK